MKHNFMIISIVLGVFVLVITIFKLTKPSFHYSDEIKIIDKWDLPESLREVSGISHINASTIACVQDEKGKIFIFDLKASIISDEIEFGPDADYEAIRIIDSTAYIMTSDGDFFKINQFESEHKSVDKFKTDFTKFNDMESFDFNLKTQNILIAPKENNLTPEEEGLVIYKMDMKTFQLQEKYFIQIPNHHEIFEFTPNTFSPSDLAIDPLNKKIYILDSKIPGLLILSPEGKPLNIYHLNPKDFPQPEGISFDQKGNIYISNEEGHSAKQNILQVEIQNH